MKARYIKLPPNPDGTERERPKAANPAYNFADHKVAKAKGKQYDQAKYLEIPVGFEEEGPLCWTHCRPGHMGEPAVCEPADDECTAAVKQWMEVERPKAVARIKEMAKPENLKKMKPKARRHVRDLAEAHGVTVDDDTTDTTTRKKKTRKTR